MTSRSPHVRACDDGLCEQDALHGPEAVRQLRDSLRLARHDEDLEAGLLVQVRVGRRPDGPKEIMLSMENAVSHRADIVAVHERDRPDDAPP